MKAKLVVIGIFILSVTALSVIYAPVTSALSLGNLVNDVIKPVTSILYPAQPNPPPSQSPSQPQSPSTNTGGKGNQPAVTAPAKPTPTQPDTAQPIPASTLPKPSDTDTKSQVAPPPDHALPPHSTTAVINGNRVVASSIPLDNAQVEGVMIQRSVEGWRIAGVAWYIWIFVMLLVVGGGLLVHHQWNRLANQAILSKK